MARKEGKRKFSSGRDRIKAAAAQQGPGGGGTMFKNIPQGVEFFNPEIPKGKSSVKYRLRLLPYIVTDPHHPDGPDIAPVGDIYYKRPFKRYRQLGAANRPYISPLSVGKPDPVAEYYKQAKADPAIPEEQANKFKPQDCVMYNVQLVENGKPGPVMFWWMSYALFEKQLKVELNDPDNDEYAAFMDLEGGFDLNVRFQKESFGGHNFLAADSISFTERGDIDESILGEVINLDDVLVIKSYEELNNIFLEIDDQMPASDPDDPGPDPDDQPETARVRKTTKPEPEKKERKKREPEPEPEAPSLTAEELDGMSFKEMRRYIVKNDLDIDTDGMEEDECREALMEACEIEPHSGQVEDSSEQCPAGLEFGEDFDTSKKCKKCDKRDDCEAAFEGESGVADPEPGPAKATKTDKKAGKAKDSGNKCPSGHKFGVDCDKQKDCDTCDEWEACMSEQESNG